VKRVLTGLMVAVIAAAADKSQDAERQLKVAMNTELLDGNLKVAIDQYKKVAQGANRPIAAQALLHMAECYQKLGDTEARKVYERVVREFGDQKEAATARAQLAGSGTSRREAATRRVWTAPPGSFGWPNAASADGRQVAYVVYETPQGSLSNLFVHDLTTGMSRQVTDAAAEETSPDKHVEPDSSAFSRDGKQLAYAWQNGTTNRYELRVVDLTGSGIPRFRRVYDSPDVFWVGPYDWSPDGKWIAVQMFRKDRSYQMALVSVPDGSLRVLKSSAYGRFAQGLKFSPDGRYLAYDQAANETEFQHDVYVMALDGTREISAVVSPSHDVLLGWSPDGGRLILSSDRTGSTGLWSQAVVDGKPQGAPEFLRGEIGNFWSLGLTSSGTLFAGVSNGRGLNIRLADFDFKSAQFLSPPADAVQEFVGSNGSPAWSPDGKSLAYLSRRPHESVLAIRSSETGKTRELRLRLTSDDSSDLSDLSWSPDGRALAVSGTDSTFQKGIFRIDTQTGEVSPIALASGQHLFSGPVWSFDGSKVYFRDFNSFSNDPISFKEHDLSTGRERDLIQRAPLGAVWLSPDGKYIATGTSNPTTKTGSFLLIPIDGGTVKELFSRQENLRGIWGWTPDSQSFLVRKGAGDELEVWRVPIDGSTPRKLDLRVDASFGALRVNLDGRRVAFQVQEPPKPQEVWVTENFLPASKAGK